MKWLILACIVLALLPVIWLRGGLFQEPIASVVVAARMEWQGHPYAELDERMLVRAGSEHDYVAVLEQDGWRLVDQLGSGYVLQRDAERRMLVCRNWSARYRICSREN